MANVLVVDGDGVGLDFSIRCSELGHSVKLFQRRQGGERDKSGDGLVEKVSDWEKWTQWADVIVPTHNSVYLDRLEDFRKYRFPIFGPSKQSAQLEINRSYGMEVLKKHMDIPPYKMFKTLDDAEQHCWKHDQKFVFKTLGSEEDKSLSYVAHDSSDMINQIHRWKKKGMRLKGSCMLQDFIPGVEMGVSAWMGSDGFLKPRGENFEFKKLMSGDYGPNTGEMGSVLWYTDKSKLAKEVLDPLESFLLSIGHRGDIDVNCIIDEKGKAWPLEFTARLGWPAFFIMCSQHEEPVQWMIDALNGKDSLKYSTEIFTGVVILQPPAPNKGEKKEDVEGVVVRGITPQNWKDVHLVQVKVGKGVDLREGKSVEKEVFLTTGTYVLVTTGSGSTMKKSARDAYSTADEILIPNPIIRDDIGEVDLEPLHQHGYALID